MATSQRLFSKLSVPRSIRARPHEALLSPLQLCPVPRGKLESQAQEQNFTDKSACERVSYSFRSALESERTLAKTVREVSRRIRDRHRTLVHWPVEAANNAMEALVSPVLDLLSQLRDPCIPCPLQATLTNLGQGSSCITISSIYSGVLDSPPVRAKTPALIVLHQGSLENGETGPNLPSFTELFGSVWRANNNDTNIICTDLRWLFILRLSKTEPNTVIYECLRLDPELVAARVVLAAYIHETLPDNAYLTYPQTIAIFDPPTVHGCQVDPSIPMLPDEEVFATHKHHHDFDLYMLMNRPALALQFLRWKSHMEACVSEIHTIRPGDNLLCSTDGFAKQHRFLIPYWPVDIQTIPTSTMECIRAVARPHALDEPARIRLATSAAFELDISEQLAPGRKPRGATVHRCRITSIDGEAIDAGAQNLCVKLFDDRLLDVHPPEEPEEVMVDADAGWWVNWSTSEDCVRREHVTYQQLSYAQGSLVPWYYGAHKFIRPDGHHLYGILMEYIPDAQTMGDIASKSEELGVEYRIQLIQNARHLVRAMQHSDVSQHDFHCEQFMVLNTPVPHLVTYDFAYASTSTEPENHEQGDYLDMLRLLVRSKLHKGQDGDTFLAHYGEPEVWDLVMGTAQLEEKGGPRWISAPDPFAWVYSDQ